MIVVKEQADHLDSYKPRSNVTIPHESRLSIEFQNLTQEILYFTVLNLTPLWEIKRLYPKEKEYQTVLPRDSQQVLSRLPNDFVKSLNIPGMVRLSVSFTVPARIRAQQQDSVSADDVLKFIVSTHPITGIQSLELPDLWHIMKYDVSREDEKFEVQVQKNLVEKSTGSGQLGGEKPMTKWTCRSIVIRTVFDGN